MKSKIIVSTPTIVCHMGSGSHPEVVDRTAAEGRMAVDYMVLCIVGRRPHAFLPLRPAQVHAEVDSWNWRR